ncbi:MAG: hypothetical protein OEM59_12855 [Rhodospirillales bacterium]|nr:hypothetical protein [Rhodospirillales bacterium]
MPGDTREPGSTMRAAFICTILAALAGCVQSDETREHLALTCQTTKCVCVPGRGALFVAVEPKSEVLWRQGGEAYCPEGQVLRPADDKSDFVKKYGG